MFWRALDERHPAYDPEVAARYSHVLEELYQEMDRVLGTVMEKLDEDTTLLVLSDHGFAPFRRSFSLNNWLLDNGVAPDAIRWIRPRDAWLLPRKNTQPLELVTSLVEGVSLYIEAAAQAENVDDLFRRLEACETLVRIDPTVEPTMYRCASISDDEVESLRRIENVVRQGRVVSIEAERIVMEDGSIPTDGGQVHVDCSAAALRLSPGRPIFESDRITLQQIRTCQPTFNAALIGFVESLDDDDEEKNRVCPPNPYPDTATDWITATRIAQGAQVIWSQRPELAAWLERSRLDAARGAAARTDDPQMQKAITRMLVNSKPAMAKLGELGAQVAATPAG